MTLMNSKVRCAEEQAPGKEGEGKVECRRLDEGMVRSGVGGKTE